MRQARSLRRGFTLIELLVVIGIIAVLVSILLPAVGEVQRQGRVSSCVSNMRQHVIGVENYASANKDTLPNGPTVPAAVEDPAFYDVLGDPGSISMFYSGQDGTPEGEVVLNNFRWNDAVRNFHSPANLTQVMNGADRMDNLQTWNAYWHPLAEYMVEGEGIDALEDVFVSPSDNVARTEVQFVKEIVRENKGGPIPNDNIQQAGGAALPSYRYVCAAQLRPQMFDHDSQGDAKFPSLISQNTSAFSIDQVAEWVREVPKSQVAYPSNKVLFFMWFAWHNPDKDAWFEVGTTIPVGLADGSARASVPSRDAIPYASGNSPESQQQLYEGAGPLLRLQYTQQQGSILHDAYFWLTNGGIRGRDFE